MVFAIIEPIPSRRCWWLLLVLLTVALAPSTTESANARQQTIVIDPGHGGQDIGYRGPAGAVEKNIVLDLARRLKTRLQQRFRVVLTRTDDYDLTLDQRTATANRERALLFVSLHLGSSASHLFDGIEFYYLDRAGTFAVAGAGESLSLNGVQPWERVQDRHAVRSRRLAAALAARCQNHSELPPVRQSGIPAALLKGANMPAVIVEFGYLSHAAHAGKLVDGSIAEKIAEALALGIGDFVDYAP